MKTKNKAAQELGKLSWKKRVDTLGLKKAQEEMRNKYKKHHDSK